MGAAIRAVFFDLGGTLFSNREIPRFSIPLLKEAAVRLGIEPRSRTIGPAYLTATRSVNLAYVHRPFYMHRDLLLDTYRRFARELGEVASPDFLDWLYEAQRQAMVDNARLRPDCRSTLVELGRRGLELSLASNIDEDYLRPMLERMGLLDAFHHITSSEEARACKPATAFFEYVLSKADRRPEESLFVGDSRTHDVKGARAAGMTSVLLVEEGGKSVLELDSVESEPHHEIGSLGELIDLTAPGPARASALEPIA